MMQGSKAGYKTVHLQFQKFVCSSLKKYLSDHYVQSTIIDPWIIMASKTENTNFKETETCIQEDKH